MMHAASCQTERMHSQYQLPTYHASFACDYPSPSHYDPPQYPANRQAALTQDWPGFAQYAGYRPPPTPLEEKQIITDFNPYSHTQVAAYMLPNSLPSAPSSVSCPDHHATPRSASEMSNFSPPIYPTDSMYNSPIITHTGLLAHTHTISMVDVQSYDDVTPEPLFDTNCNMYIPPVQNTYQSNYTPVVEAAPTPESLPSENAVLSQDEDSDYIDTSTARSRRPTNRASKSSQRRDNRVTKRTTKRRTSTSNARDRAAIRRAQAGGDAQSRSFCCLLAPYGCKSTFGSKNEWKRHFSTQHLRLSFWRCDQCPAGEGRSFNDFNRKDLFMQHVRRMHTEQRSSHASRRTKGKQVKDVSDDHEALDAAVRCRVELRVPPTRSTCVICEESFTGPASWDKRMEHMGKHFETAQRSAVNGVGALHPEIWHVDHDVEDWMLERGILRTTAEGAVVIAEDVRD